MVLADRCFRHLHQICGRASCHQIQTEEQPWQNSRRTDVRLEYGLGWKWLAVLFSLFTALAAFGIGSTVQANAIATLTYESYGISPTITGCVLCLLTAAVVLGGIKNIARVCSMLVPFMALFYTAGCIYIIDINAAYIWPAIKLICVSAFSPNAAGGGFIGATVMMAARYGIARGLFSNESGLGSAPIVAAAAKTRNPVQPGTGVQ